MAQEDDVSADAVRAAIRQAYAETAGGKSILGGSGGCCGPDRDHDLASQKLGYTPEDLQTGRDDEANLGLGCGNPLKIANLAKGEIVCDLGSGAGFDALLAARRVGPTGSVIGVDMTPDMISKARANVKKAGIGNVSFRLGEIEYLPVADGVADVVMSNCVINLSMDKPQVLREAFRVLRPGGRVAVTDVVQRKDCGPMPESLRTAEALAC